MKCEFCGNEYNFDDIKINIISDGKVTYINRIQLADGSTPHLCTDCLRKAVIDVGLENILTDKDVI